MKITGITAEYNPLHNGHKFHIEKTRELTEADCIVAVMSGNFTQRGEAAILDKWERSKLAVDNGVDLVLELPFVYACSRAESFASGAVDILQGIGATSISFGSESGDISALNDLITSIEDNADSIERERIGIMKSGTSFAKAGEMAVEQILGTEAAKLMVSPNNILALEYLKRITYWNKQGHDIEAITVKRHGSGYHGINEEAGFAGASAIRKMRSKVHFSEYVPEDVAEALEKAFSYGDGKGALLHMEEEMFRLLRGEVVKSPPEELRKVFCMGEGLENKLKKEIVKAESLSDFVDSLVSKRYTEAAIRRLLVYVLLGIKEYEPSKAVYGRVLAAGEKGRKLLGDLRKSDEHMPLITNINKDEIENGEVQDCVAYDILAADMYNVLLNRDLYSFSDRVRRPYMAGI